MTQKADHILDLRGFILPIALLKVSQLFREMAPEQTLEILCHDSDTSSDLLKILPAYSCELIFVEEAANDHSFRFHMKKKNIEGS